MHAAAKDAWECAQGRDNGQNDPLTGNQISITGNYYF